MRACREENSARFQSRDFAALFECACIVDVDPIRIANGDPDLMSTRREFHVQNGRSGLEFVNDSQRQHIDDLDRVVAGVREIDLGMAPIGARYCKDGLSMELDPSAFLKGRAIKRQKFVAPHSRQ